MDVANNVYIVDSDQAICRSVVALLAGYGINVKCFDDSDLFVGQLGDLNFDNSCVLIGIEAYQQGKLSFLHTLQARGDAPPVIVVGYDISAGLRQEVLEAGATDCLDKSVITAYLFTRLSDLLPGTNGLPHTAPSDLVVDDGARVTLRLMHPEDSERQQSFVVGLSDHSRYLRFFSGIKKLPDSVLKDFTSPDYPYSYAVVATVHEGLEEQLIGVARYAPTGTEGVAEFAVVVADDWHGKGVATKLMSMVILAATIGGIRRLEGLILRENDSMKALARKLGFSVSDEYEGDPSAMLYTRELREGQNTDPTP
jgi:RimJ/RimL family protein N-acetyltransferase/CheY-like chemotaxis protein